MLNMIVAYNKNRGIGFKNKIPWRISSDLKRFKFLTIGNKNNSVIMGRKTWESLHTNIKPLYNRNNIIISKTIDKIHDKNINVFETIDEANYFCKINNFDENWIIGGSEIYKEYLKRDMVDNLYVTEIDLYNECDAFFPDITSYKIMKEGNLLNGPHDKIDTINENNINFRYKIYTKHN